MREEVGGSEKLQKVLARLGYGSRRACEAMIAAERVQVNGLTAKVGTRVNPSMDKVKVDGEIVGIKPDLIYVLLNKPRGYLSAVTDPRGRQTVMDLLPPLTRIYPVGRLDFESEGLLILTNDGDFTNLITHPSHGVEKEYLVQLDRRISDKAILRLRKGVELSDGKTAPAKVTRMADNLIRMVIHEGRNRQIRRMCDAMGYGVRRLVRTRIGTLKDAKLSQGGWRYLGPSEVVALRKEASVSTGVKAQSRP